MGPSGLSRALDLGGLGPPGILGGVTDPKVPHAFFVAFDQEDRVLAFSLEKIGIWRRRPIQQAAREWAKRQGLAVPDLPPRFVALDTPSGQAALYIYHAAGSPAPPPQVWVDGKLEAELKKGTYVALALSPGNHIVKVVAIPESVSPDLGKTLSLDLVPNMKYFLSVENPWISWTGELEEINLQSEQEAMPVLSQLAPA